VPKFWVSPSQVARFYFHECERYLRYRAATREQRAADGIPKFEPDRSLLTKAILDGGVAWEARLLAGPLAGRAIVAGGTGDLVDRRHTVGATLEALARLRPGEALYQPTLQAPPSFYERYGIDPDLVGITDCHPDLVVAEPDGQDADSAFELRVVDAKATEMMKLSHRIQVGLYSLLLDHAVTDAGLDARVARTGGVWLYEQPEPEWFELARIMGQLETFLAHDLTRILITPAPDAFWHLYFRCEWCDYYEHCRAEADTRDDVSLVPYLSTFAKRHLAEREVGTVGELATLLQQPDADEQLTGCASLEGRAPQLRLSVEALQHKETKPRGAASVGMPVGEQVLVTITVQSEPLEGRVYGYAIYRAKARELFGRGTDTYVRVAPDGRPETLRDLRRALVADLIAIFRTVHDHNTAHADWREQKSVQAYVFDTYEHELLVQTLVDAVLDPAVAEDALALLFHFQHPDLVQAEDHPATEVFFPLVVLTSVIRNLLAMPIPVVYRFADVVAELAPSQYAFDYRPSDFFNFALSNRVKSNAIFEIWERGRADLVENLEGELKRRVWAANSVISGLRERLGGSGALFAWPPKFFLPKGFGFDDPVLSRLAFIARYEAVLAYLATRTARAASREERLARGTTVELVYRGDGVWEADPAAVELARLEPDSFFNFIVTPDTDDGRRARLAYDDFSFRSRMYPPKRLAVALASIHAVDGGRIRLELKPSPEFPPPVAGMRVSLEPRYTDWNTEKLVDELAALDAEGGGYRDVLYDPVEARAAPWSSREIEQAARDLGARHGMTPSQLGALDGLLGYDLHVVWGPPGTGKTHFLALAVLCLAEAYRRAGRPLRVIVTAFTHTAIDNVLRKIAALQAERRVFEGSAPLPLYKLRSECEGAVRLDPKQLPTVGAQHQHAVFGSTVWQLCRCSPDEFAAELVVIDEGSQLTAGEAAIAYRRRAARGRLVVAGDPEQLPPIVQGAYPTPDGEPPLHRSVLECLRFADPDGERGLVTPLLENFRMNDRLCAYPAASIYPPDYGPATDAIAQARLAFASAALADLEAGEFLAAVLDPAWPLAVCVLEDVQATRENPHEAALCALVAEALRRQRPDEPAEVFWRERLFVVSPHHAHNRLIRRRLRERLGPGPTFVDTVDKMQGQECDAVIVSYGVADVEYALGEKEFIYQRNRLNVAITRARVKTVVLISRRLLEPPIQALERDDVADGIAFMQGLARHCEEASGALELTACGQRVTVLRA
jgi:hypothetical protein